MRYSCLAVLLLVGASCSASPTAAPLANVIADLSSREQALLTGAVIADLRVNGTGRITVMAGDEGTGRSFVVFPSGVSAQLVSFRQLPIPGDLPLAILYTYGVAGESQGRRVDWVSSIGVSDVVSGGRYLAIFAGSVRNMPDLPLLIALKRVDGSGRLVDPALGYPAGAAVSSILDPSGIPASLLYGHDAGVQTLVDGTVPIGG